MTRWRDGQDQKCNGSNFNTALKYSRGKRDDLTKGLSIDDRNNLLESESQLKLSAKKRKTKLKNKSSDVQLTLLS